MRKSQSGLHQTEEKQGRQENVHQGWKPNVKYDAMGRMISRIRAVSTNAPVPNENDEVFHKIERRNQKSRNSVIRSVPKEDMNLQQYYNVPVHNPFTDPLN